MHLDKLNDRESPGLSREPPYEFLGHDVQVESLYEWLRANRQWRVARAGNERRAHPAAAAPRISHV